MTVMVLIVLGVLGAAVGSFLTVVVHRVPLRQSVAGPRSHCPSCGTKVRPRHLVPIISYLALRGRCASCGTPISVRYPLLEVVTALLFVAVGLWGGATGRPEMVPVGLYLVSIGLALALIDLAVHRLPDVIVLPSYPIVAGLLVVASAISGDWWALGRAGIGAAAVFALYLLLTLIHPRGMGWGDVKLSGLLGGILGYVGWGTLVVGVFAGFLLGSLVAIGMIVMRRGTGKTALPFGPFMLLGAVVGLLWGAGLAHRYLDLLAW